MPIRNALRVACVSLATALTAFGAGAQGVSYIFQLPGAGSAATRILAYSSTANPLNPSIDANGPAGAFQIIPKPDGSKFYILATGSGTNVLQSTDSAFSSFHNVTGFSAGPSIVTMTPDGKYALVGAGTNIYVVDTNTDQIIGNVIPISGTTAGIAVSRDSKTAYAVVNLASGANVIAFTVATGLPTGTALSLTGGAQSITLSPLGLLYVTAANRIFEINPSTLQLTAGGTIAVNATPGPLRYTGDGSTAYFINKAPAIGNASFYQMNVATHSLSAWPGVGSNNPAQLFDEIYVAGPNNVVAYSSAAGTVYDITSPPLTAAITALGGQSLQAGHVAGVAVTNELPLAQSLFALVNVGSSFSLTRVDLATNTVPETSIAPVTTGIMQLAVVPPQSGAASFIKYNDPQTLTAGATSAPLIVRVLDGSGRPVFNDTVTFTTTSGTGVTINTPTSVTNSDGWAQTTIGMPSAPGTYVITATAETASTNFTLTIPGAVNGGGSSPQVTIVGGDGQMVPIGQLALEPLTMKVTDPSGHPLSGVAVSFAVVSPGISTVSPTQTTTDVNGLAQTIWSAGAPGGDLAFVTDTVTGVTSAGAVTFTETSLASDPSGISLPNVLLPLPGNFGSICPSRGPNLPCGLAEGATLAGGVVASVGANFGSQAGTPIQGIGVKIASPSVNSPLSPDFTLPSPASCLTSSLSDRNGQSICDVVASCTVGTGTFPIIIVVGDFAFFDATITIVPGNANKIAVTAGNNQSGKSGQGLTTPLIATITDGCGSPLANIPVRWTITQGSATLFNTNSTSNNNGQVSTNVTFGASAGAVVVTASLVNGTGTATFTLTNSIVLSGIAIVSGNNQSILAGQPFSQPLVVVVRDTNNNPVSGVGVAFAIASGSASLGSTSVTTNGTGQASTTVTAGAVAGPISITASITGANVTFSLTSTPVGPSITASSFVNAASFTTGLAPCGLGSVFGSGLAPTVTGIVSNIAPYQPLSYTLASDSMTVNGIPAPIQAVANVNGVQQINFQVPCETAPGSATIIVTANGAVSTVTGVQILAAKPGIFSFTQNGKTYGSVISAVDGSYITPQHFAARGGDYYMVATGLGQVSPSTGTNDVGIPGVTQTVNLTVVVGLDVGGVPVVSAQYLPGSVGVYLVRFTIPANFPVTGADKNLSIGEVVNGNTIFHSVLIGGIQ